MDTADIEKIIIEALRELQAGCGQPEQEITAATTPLSDLGFFDSLLGIETTLVLEEHLKCKVGDDNVFKDKDTDEALSISQMAARLAQIAGKAA